ncbi:MAG: hypothetical protein JTT11_09960 [Candidatus Brockarchaeota archaeon]|nr:hypothetical protein [Candidatus Brockarchaeota archaeon]
MNIKERILAVLHGEKPDKVPFLPYDNLIPRGELERTLRNKEMGFCVRCGTYWTEQPNVKVETSVKGNVVTTTYETPAGKVSTAYKAHLGRGVESQQLHGMIRTEADYDAAIYMVDDTVFHSEYENYHNAVLDLGCDGIVRGSGIEPPYYESVWFYWPNIASWVVAQYKQKHEFQKLLRALERRTERLLPVIIDSPAEFVSFGGVSGHYGPTQYERYDLPFYQKYVPILKAKGKICSAHAHSSDLKFLKHLIGQTGLDVIEAFTPPPIGNLSVSEAREVWGEDVVIWVNFPETVFWSGPEETRRYAVELLKSDAPGDRLVIGMTEMGTLGIKDGESEKVYWLGMHALADSINEHGRYPIEP